MKKSGYLLLLTPALFLASCQTTPKIDTIDENEARAIIANFPSDITSFKTPTTESKVKWKITKDDNGSAKQWISQYIYIGVTELPTDKSELNIDSGRCATYISELSAQSSDYMQPTKDALIGMNSEIYAKLYELKPSPSNDVGPFYLEYKKNGGGIKIISKSTIAAVKDTRTHYYNEFGQETKFEVDINKDGIAYTMTIDFKYPA